MATCGTCLQRGLIAQSRQIESVRCFPTNRSARALGCSSVSHIAFRSTSQQHTCLTWNRRHPKIATHIVAAATEEEITVEEDAMEKMDKSLEKVSNNFASVRTGRATPNMLDRVQVDYYGTMTPLKSLAGISAPEAQLLVVQPYDKTAMQAIEKAIMLSDLGANPSNDGNLIRIAIPSLTADRRKEMTKSVSKLAEEGKVSVRNARREAMKAIDKHEKDGDITEDDKKSLSDSVQKLTDDYVKQIETLAKNKSDELTKI